MTVVETIWDEFPIGHVDVTPDPDTHTMLHTEIVVRFTDLEIVTMCTCGLSWRGSPDEVDAAYEAHRLENEGLPA